MPAPYEAIRKQGAEILTKTGSLKFDEPFFIDDSYHVRPYEVNPALIEIYSPDSDSIKNSEDNGERTRAGFWLSTFIQGSFAEFDAIATLEGNYSSFGTNVANRTRSPLLNFSKELEVGRGVDLMRVLDGKKVVYVGGINDTTFNPRILEHISQNGGEVLGRVFFVGENGNSDYVLAPLNREEIWNELRNSGEMSEREHQNLIGYLSNPVGWVREALLSDEGLERLAELRGTEIDGIRRNYPGAFLEIEKLNGAHKEVKQKIDDKLKEIDWNGAPDLAIHQ